MSEILLLILLVLLVLAGMLAVAVAFQWTRRARLALKARLALVAPFGKAGVPLPHGFVEDLAILGRRFRGLFLLGLQSHWGVTWTGWQLFATGLAAGIGGLVLLLVLGLPVVLALLTFVVLFWAIPRLEAGMQQNRAEKNFIVLFPDVLDTITRMLRAGLPVSAAMRAVGQENLPTLSKLFNDIADKTDIGMPFGKVLEEASAQVRLADFRFFVVAISLQRATGGNLAATLEMLSNIIRQRRNIRIKARSTTAEVRMSAIVLGSIPFLVVAGLLMVQPDYLHPLIADYRGNVILVSAVISLLLGFLTMRQLLRSVTRIQ